MKDLETSVQTVSIRSALPENPVIPWSNWNRFERDNSLLYKSCCLFPSYFSCKQSFWNTLPPSPLPDEQRSTEFILILYMALFPLSFPLLYPSSIGPTDYLTSPASDVFEDNSFLVLTPWTTCSSEPFLACLIVFNTYLPKLFFFFFLLFCFPHLNRTSI